MGKISKQTRNTVYEKYNGRCAYCGCKINILSFHVDHIEAKYRGTTQDQLISWGSDRIKGKDHIDNYNPSCKSCNSSKSTFTIESWRNELELKKERIKRDSSTFNILLRFGVIKEVKKPIIFYFETLQHGK